MQRKIIDGYYSKLMQKIRTEIPTNSRDSALASKKLFNGFCDYESTESCNRYYEECQQPAHGNGLKLISNHKFPSKETAKNQSFIPEESSSYQLVQMHIPYLLQNRANKTLII